MPVQWKKPFTFSLLLFLGFGGLGFYLYSIQYAYLFLICGVIVFGVLFFYTAADSIAINLAWNAPQAGFIVGVIAGFSLLGDLSDPNEVPLDKLAESGDARAQYQLAMVKRFTEKGSEDTRLLVAAARQGYAPAQYQLGLDMESGQLHPEVAYMLFSLAARNGDEAAGKSLESLRNRMSELQIEVGERMIGDWDTRWHNGREQSKARTQ